MADEACLDERFNKDKVWNRSELTLDVEAQAAESTAFSSLKDIWEENMLSMQPLFLFLPRNCPCLLLPKQSCLPGHDSGTSQEQKPCQLA